MQIGFTDLHNKVRKLILNPDHSTGAALTVGPLLYTLYKNIGLGSLAMGSIAMQSSRAVTISVGQKNLTSIVTCIKDKKIDELLPWNTGENALRAKEAAAT